MDIFEVLDKSLGVIDQGKDVFGKDEPQTETIVIEQSAPAIDPLLLAVGAAVLVALLAK